MYASWETTTSVGVTLSGRRRAALSASVSFLVEALSRRKAKQPRPHGDILSKQLPRSGSKVEVNQRMKVGLFMHQSHILT